MGEQKITSITITWSDGDSRRIPIDQGTTALVLTLDKKSGEGILALNADEMGLHLLIKRIINFAMENSEMAQSLLAAFALAMVPVPNTLSQIAVPANVPIHRV